MRSLLLIACLAVIGCANEDASRAALRNHGFTEIEITGWSPFSCSRDDSWSTGFRAKNPVGKMVRGVVCCGLVFKSCTVRF